MIAVFSRICLGASHFQIFFFLEKNVKFSVVSSFPLGLFETLHVRRFSLKTKNFILNRFFWQKDNLFIFFFLHRTVTLIEFLVLMRSFVIKPNNRNTKTGIIKIYSSIFELSVWYNTRIFINRNTMNRT